MVAKDLAPLGWLRVIATLKAAHWLRKKHEWNVRGGVNFVDHEAIRKHFTEDKRRLFYEGVKRMLWIIKVKNAVSKRRQAADVVRDCLMVFKELRYNYVFLSYQIK